MIIVTLMNQDLCNFLSELSKFNQWLIKEQVKSKADLKRKYKTSGLTQSRALKLYDFLNNLNDNINRFNK